MQNTVCHTILLADKRTNSSDMHAELNLLKLNDRCNLHFKIECYENVYNQESSLSKFFVLDSNKRAKHTRRNEAQNMHVPDI